MGNTINGTYTTEWNNMVLVGSSFKKRGEKLHRNDKLKLSLLKLRLLLDQEVVADDVHQTANGGTPGRRHNVDPGGVERGNPASKSLQNKDKNSSLKIFFL